MDRFAHPEGQEGDDRRHRVGQQVANTISVRLDRPSARAASRSRARGCAGTRRASPPARSSRQAQQHQQQADEGAKMDAKITSRYSEGMGVPDLDQALQPAGRASRRSSPDGAAAMPMHGADGGERQPEQQAHQASRPRTAAPPCRGRPVGAQPVRGGRRGWAARCERVDRVGRECGFSVCSRQLPGLSNWATMNGPSSRWGCRSRRRSALGRVVPHQVHVAGRCHTRPAAVVAHQLGHQAQQQRGQRRTRRSPPGLRWKGAQEALPGRVRCRAHRPTARTARAGRPG